MIAQQKDTLNCLSEIDVLKSNNYKLMREVESFRPLTRLSSNSEEGDIVEGITMHFMKEAAH
jgi:hypothetical protein